MIRKILWLLATFLLAHSQLAAAQHPVKNARIGFLFFGSTDQPHLQSFHHDHEVPSRGEIDDAANVLKQL